MERLEAIAHRRQLADPMLLARPGALVRQAVRVHEGRRQRDALCELDGAGVRITDREDSRTVAWPDLRSVVADRGRVCIVLPNGEIVLSIAPDGVIEPGLAPFFVRVLADGRSGTLDRTGALHELTLAIDHTVEGFSDADDPVVPLAIGGFAAIVGVILLAAVPLGSQLAAHITPAAGAFVILPRLSTLDPRVVVAAFAGGATFAAAVARIALGPAAVSWARGTLRGWHPNATGLEDQTRRAIARLVLSWRIVALVAAIALLLAMPSAFARTVVDSGGIHAASGLPFLSTDLDWSVVTDVVPVAVGFAERPEGFVTTLVLADGSRLSTRGRDLVGGSERAFYEFSRAHAR